MVGDADPERLRDRVRGDVVVGGADPARSEHVAVPRARLVDRLHDHRLVVGKDPRLPELDSELREPAGHVVEIAIRGAAGQHLVADHEHARVHFAAHRPSVSLPGSTKITRARAGLQGASPMHVGYSAIFQNPDDALSDYESIGTSSGSPSSPSARLRVDLVGRTPLHDYTMCPDVVQFLTYMAGRTVRAKLGTMVIGSPGTTRCGWRRRSPCSTTSPTGASSSASDAGSGGWSSRASGST